MEGTVEVVFSESEIEEDELSLAALVFSLSIGRNHALITLLRSCRSLVDGISYWVARSTMVHSHLLPAVLMWNLRLLVSRAVRRRTSSLGTILTAAADDEDILVNVWGWMGELGSKVFQGTRRQSVYTGSDENTGCSYGVGALGGMDGDGEARLEREQETKKHRE